MEREVKPLKEGVAGPNQAVKMFQKLVADVEDSLGRVAQQAAQNGFVVERAELEIRTLLDESGQLGVGLGFVVLRIGATVDYLESAVHTITLILEPKPPAPKLTATSDALVQAIVSALGAVSQIDKQNSAMLAPTKLKVKVYFDVSDAWGISLLVGRNQKRADMHSIEIHFKRSPAA